MEGTKPYPAAGPAPVSGGGAPAPVWVARAAAYAKLDRRG
jgi:hypothetical protein